ncbi:MAG TPA: 30S ribosomal protein S21 [Candidatus Pacearchaeota archaeon]|nr:30S ribosomal protein S21 [Candidatus Pacearchaeota archaeon]HOK94276.1 30S ribosomal protein S21 [Candidatus Pacearchaeota archaeon]HPO75447.1 30S ribosomal protein S21 [Candidatus Pacearchaeota archaeon]
MVEVRKKQKETTFSLVRRFSSKLRMSGILQEVKKRQYYQPPLNEREKREKALKRINQKSKIK